MYGTLSVTLTFRYIWRKRLNNIWGIEGYLENRQALPASPINKRRYQKAGIMKEIQLTQGKIALVDDCDYERLNRHKWCAVKHFNTFYAVRNSPRINGKQRRIHMHHEIIGKPSKNLVTDHKNGDGLRNLRSNLRHVTQRQNTQNKKNIKKTSIYSGVSWHKKVKRWYAYISIKKKRKYLGCFIDELQAFESYKKAVENLGKKML